jgi:hypothetical protein
MDRNIANAEISGFTKKFKIMVKFIINREREMMVMAFEGHIHNNFNRFHNN